MQVVFAISRGASVCAENVFSKNQKTKNRNRRDKKIEEAKLLESLEKQKRIEELRNGEVRIVLHLRPLPTASRCSAARMHSQKENLLHLKSAPNEATTSIWLKAMMVRSDLSRNTEFLENESGTEVEREEPKGRSPRGESGLILIADRSARALYLRGNLYAGWGIQLGGTDPPA